MCVTTMARLNQIAIVLNVSGLNFSRFIINIFYASFPYISSEQKEEEVEVTILKNC